MTITIPADGIDEIRRVWAGRGGLWAGLAATEDDDGFTWTPAIARARATRVVIEVLQPALENWPAATRQWIDALPAQSTRHHIVEESPGAGVDWTATRLTGWPPREFHHRRRNRVADTLLVTATRWTIDALRQAIIAVDGLDPDLVPLKARDRASVASAAAAMEPLASSHPTSPTRSDLRALRLAGRPWASVAAVAELLLVLDHDPARLAATPLDPDPVLAERLFHVAVLGVLLRALRLAGWRLEVVGLPGGKSSGPKFRAFDVHGLAWDIWYEASGAWTHYKVPAPYPLAVAGVEGTGGPLGADVALIRHGDHAVLVECKYSANPTYVGRNGYEQTLAYMAEALTGMSPRATGIVVGPVEVVAQPGSTLTAVGTVHVTNPNHLAQAVLAATEPAVVVA
jgi:hypothetical protein